MLGAVRLRTMAGVDFTVVLIIAVCVCSTWGDRQSRPHMSKETLVAEDKSPNVHCSCNCALPTPTDRQTCDSVGHVQSDLDALLSWKGTATNLLHHLKNALQIVSNRLDDVLERGSLVGPKESLIDDIVANMTTVLSKNIRKQIKEATDSMVRQVKGPYPLGIESGEIPDAQMTASSEFNRGHGPQRARLYQVADGEGIGGWCAKSNNGNQWLQVDLGKLAEVWGVITQGRFRDYSQWVSTYKLSFSTDGDNWRPYTDLSGRQKVFQGNIDFETPQRRLLARPVTARYVRFLPQTWQTHICMRVDVLGRFQ